MVKNKKSFTLIEIIITVGIISLFSGLALASYNYYTQSKKLESEIEKLYDVLNLAHKKTISGDYSGFSCSTFNGYKIYIINNQYFFQISCDGDWRNIQTYTLKGLTITNSNIIFDPLTGYLNSSITAPVTITITNPNISKSKQIQIERTGKINKL